MLWSSILVVVVATGLFQWAFLLNARRLILPDRNSRIVAFIISFLLIAIGVSLVILV